jgi:multidrug efflux pump subunit AcrA (membrane-fusion protein)
MALRLHSRKTYLTTLPEGQPPPRRAASVARIVYVAGLVLVLTYIAHFLLMRIWMATAPGVVVPEELIVRAHERAIITGLAVSPGDTVTPGQTLFTMHFIREASPARVDPFALDRARAERDVMVRDRELSLVGDAIQRAEAHLAHLRALRALELNRERYGERRQIEVELESLRLKQASALSELSAYHEYQSALARLEVPEPTQALSSEYHTPIAGTVVAVDRNNHEYVREGERIMLLKDPHGLQIRGYFAQDDLRYLQPGKEVQIALPDGKQGSGVIRRLGSSMTEIPALVRHEYTPTEPSVTVEVEVLSPDAQTMVRYENLTVTLKVVRWR